MEFEDFFTTKPVRKFNEKEFFSKASWAKSLEKSSELPTPAATEFGSPKVDYGLKLDDASKNLSKSENKMKGLSSTTTGKSGKDLPVTPTVTAGKGLSK